MVLIGNIESIKKARTQKFIYKEGERKEEGFAVYFRGKFYAYVNRCKHVPLPLDFGDGDFLTDDRKFILCRNHGALYEPVSGECVAGPCAGQSLDRLEVEKKGKKLYCRIGKPA